MIYIMKLTTSRTSRGAPAVRRILCAAALSSLSGSSWAFVSPPPYFPSVMPSSERAMALGSRNYPIPPQTKAQHQNPRLFFSQKDNDWETFKRSGSNLLKKGVDKIKSLVPFGKSEEEKRAAIIKKERKEEITGGINTMLKDMPLPIRMMGRMVSPLLARAANEIAEQAQQAQGMLDEARIRLVNDPYVAENLGTPVQVGQPFSQSSSTTVINGQSSARVQASFQVVGPLGSGIATMESNNGEISSLTVNVNGRNISVGLVRGGRAFSKSSSKKGDIIEAEIIEKK